MSVQRPYKRTYRPFVNGMYCSEGNDGYVEHQDYAIDPQHYIRAFELLQKDFIHLLDFVEPHEDNLNTFSFRIQELHVRTCIEVESNFKAILEENNYPNKSLWNMKDYRKIESTHELSKFVVTMPNWHNKEYKSFTPFEQWGKGRKQLPWYKAYNKSKHSRHKNFHKSNFAHLIDSITGLTVLLSAQFGTNGFRPGSDNLVLESRPKRNRPNFAEEAIGGYFLVNFPGSIFSHEKRYNFNWADIKNENSPFQTIW